ncbi:hypothetical protein [Streptomyces parvulus]
MPSEERYHLALTLGGPSRDGWWGDEAIARRKFAAWVGRYGSQAGVQITLVDEEQGVTLTTWPEEA